MSPTAKKRVPDKVPVTPLQSINEHMTNKHRLIVWFTSAQMARLDRAVMRGRGSSKSIDPQTQKRFHYNRGTVLRELVEEHLPDH